MSHTKGPWNLLPSGHGNRTPGCGEGFHIENEEGRPVIDGSWYGSICNEGDLPLIAAAPEMLSALEGLVKAFENMMGPSFAAKGSLYVAAANAIAKARGNNQ